MNCPKCGAVSGVVSSRHQATGSILRRRCCKQCQYRWSTIELLKERAALVEEIARMVAAATFTTEHVAKITRMFAPLPQPVGRKHSNLKRRTISGVKRRHGIVVPPEMEDDWQVLKKAGYRDADAAAALGLPLPSKSA